MLTNDDLSKIKGLLSSTEQKLSDKIESSEKRMEAAIVANGKQISSEIADFIDDTLLPQISDKADKSTIKSLKERLTKIESLPAVAHELKRKK